jgi:universal stress protein A
VRFRHLLVPLDFSPHGRRAVALAKRVVGPRGRLRLLHVSPAFPNQAAERGMAADAGRRLEALAKRLRRGAQAPVVETRVATGDPFQRIVEASRDTDGIVMCTRGRTGVPHLVIGSVAEKVVRHATVPVLTFAPRRARR